MSEFDTKVKQFNKFYLWLVIAVGALCAAAVLCAVYVRVFVGIVIGICAALAYVFLLSDELHRAFGVRYRRVEGGISLSVIAPKKPQDTVERYLPARLMWLDVVSLSAPEGKYAPDTVTRTLFIPATVKVIEKGALSGMTALCQVVYMGLPEQWQTVETGDELEGLQIAFGIEDATQASLEDNEENEG